MKTWLDTTLARLTMYRLVLYALIVLAAAAFIAAFADGLGFAPRALAVSLVVLLAVTYLSSRLFAALFRVTPHTESSLITGLLLFFILLPTDDPVMLLQIALAAFFASGSKYLLAVRGRHVFNPAAVGAVWLGICQIYLAVWWVGSKVLLPVTIVLVLLVLYRTRRLPLGAAFVVIAAVIVIARSMIDGSDFGTAIGYAFGQTPLIFLGGFMLSEPLTLPPLRWQQLTVAGVVAVLFAIPMTVGSFLVGPESALIVGNLLAFAFGQRRGIALVLTAKRMLTPSTIELEFRPDRRLRFRPGQYLELTVPHAKVDARGSRRVFSISSTPTADQAVTVGIKVPANGSSFKRAVQTLEVGHRLHATGVGGDFVLPADARRPLLLIAGGIGITPFASQLDSLDPADGWDVVVIYAVSDADEVAYADLLQRSGARVVVVTGSDSGSVPEGLEHQTGRLDQAMLASIVPDLSDRHVFVSGPPAFVNTIGGSATALKARRVTRDYFSGY